MSNSLIRTRKTLDNLIYGSFDYLTSDYNASLQTTSILKTRYIKSTDDLELNQAGTKYILEIGRYFFDNGTNNPFVLDKPFEINVNGGTARIIELSGEVLYTGAETLFEDAIGDNLVLRSNNLVLIGNNSNDLFNLTYNSSGNRPVIVFTFSQFINFNSLGLLEGFGIVVFNTLSVSAIQQGIEISETDRFCIITNSIFSDESNALTYLTFTGTTNITPTLEISSTNYDPVNNSTAFINIANNLQPNCIIVGNNFTKTDAPSASFFDTFSLDQTSIYLLTRANKNINESKIALQSFFNNTTTTTINVANQWHTINYGTTTTTTERVSFDNTTGLITILSLEGENIQIGKNKTATAATGSNIIFETAFFSKTNNTSVVADNTTNTFTATAHGFNNGDLLWFLDSDTLPTNVLDTVFYYVVNATTNTFQVSNTSGGAALNFTTNGVNVAASLMTLLIFRAEDEYNSGRFISNSLVVFIDVVEGYQFVLATRNTSGTNNKQISNLNIFARG